MPAPTKRYRDITRSVSSALVKLRAAIPDTNRGF